MTPHASILVADDDEATRYVVRGALEHEGFTVIEAASGSEAAEKWREHRPDLILLDVEMPGSDGYSACREIRRSHGGRNVPIIMVTGNDDSESIATAFDAGATDFVAKPINWSLLGHRVRYVLRAAAQVQKIHRLAYYDMLTGLPNRSLFHERLDAELESLAGGSLGVFSINLDRFKRINDTLGEKAGDEVLAEVARRLEILTEALGFAHGQACAAAFGGDDYALYVIDPLPDFSDIASDIRNSIAEPFVVAGREFVLTASVGVATTPDHGNSAEALIRNAETACNEAGLSGRNMQRFYKRSMGVATREGLDLENELRRALENNELSLLFQPKFAARTLIGEGAEALLRWRHPERGMIPPSTFIPIAEDSGLIVELGEWIADRVCRLARRMLNRGILSGPIAINMSGKEFGLGDPVRVLTDAVARAGIPASTIEIEITESILMSDIPSVTQALADLRDAGFSVAVDDFGTGYSSLRYLQKFPVDVLKIDGSFVHDLRGDPDSRAICGAIIAMGRNLGMRVVAEGVESNWQRDFLSSKSCTYLQGYLLSRPLDAADFSRHLAEHRRRRKEQALPDAMKMLAAG